MVKNKRRHDGQSRQHEEETVDDLAVAASFALQQPLSTGVTIPNLDETPNEPDSSITNDMKNEEDPKDSTESEKKIVELQVKSLELKGIDAMPDEEQKENKAETESDDESDDESVVNLSESLVKMEEEDSKTTKQTLKTEHELDINKCSLDDLSKQLNLDLTVDEEKEKEQLHHAHLVPAGSVKSHLVQGRIIIVESNCQDALEEGCLFVMKVDNKMLNNTTGDDETIQKEILIPIARIFEVFGPILKPLYSLRLPTVRQNECSKKNLDSAPERSDSTKNDDANVKNDDPNSKEEKEKSNNSNSDPWSSTGIYTQILKKNPNLTVYLDQKDRKIINTDHILRSSGKGSDASNVFDEEVVNTNELDFSDDEEERQFKQQRRKKKNNNNNNNNTVKKPPRRWNSSDPRQQMQNTTYSHQPQIAQNWNNAPMGNYNQPQMVPPPQFPYHYASQNYAPPLPQNPHTMMYSVPPPTMYQVPPPPPPPPPIGAQFSNNYHTNPNTVQTNYNIQPPVDPRKKEEDTVYYDYS